MTLMLNVRSAIVLAAVLLCGCGSTSDTLGDYRDTDAASVADEEVQPFDEDSAREQAEEEVADDGYSGPCTFDCSGHEAGFTYAAEGQSDGGVSSSPSFDEGQEAYEEAVEERVDELRDAHESGEDDQ